MITLQALSNTVHLQLFVATTLYDGFAENWKLLLVFGPNCVIMNNRFTSWPWRSVYDPGVHLMTTTKNVIKSSQFMTTMTYNSNGQSPLRSYVKDHKLPLNLLNSAWQRFCSRLEGPVIGGWNHHSLPLSCPLPGNPHPSSGDVSEENEDRELPGTRNWEPGLGSKWI